MGGGPDQEHVLIIFLGPEPKAQTAQLKQQFPYFDITYVQLSLDTHPFDDRSKSVPAGELCWPLSTISHKRAIGLGDAGMG